MFDENKKYICNRCKKNIATVYLFDEQINEYATICKTCYFNKYRGTKYNWLPIVLGNNNENKLGFNGIHLGDVIFIYDPIFQKKYNKQIGEISITVDGIMFKDNLYGKEICPLSIIDSNEPWGYDYLYFSTDKKRSKWIENNK